jgi:hypothetical protein
MNRLYLLCIMALPFPTLADTFDRPTPQAQSATAEFWFAFASFALIAALVLVAKLVARK